MDPLLKQRLVGTAVLVGLAVIFVPMILDGPVERSDAPRSIGVPLPVPDLVPESEFAPEPAPEPAPAVEQPAAAALDEAGWAVQFGSFADADNAEALAARITGAGFDAFVQRVQVVNGTMYRVRVGPLANREAAAALAERAARATDERAVVVPHP